MKLIYTSLLTALLISCGGDNNEKKPSITAFADSLKIDQATELFLYTPQSEVSDIVWTQKSGENINLLTPHQKGIAFTPPTVGNYVFEVSFIDENNIAQTLSQTITVNNEVSNISARLGHVVSEGNKVSLRASINETFNIENITWVQISGPTVTLLEDNSSDKAAIFFNAPIVTQDTFVTFESSITENGNTHQDTVAVLIENKENISSNALFDERVSDVYSYNTNSPYKSQLEKCIYNSSFTSSDICTLNELPLIAHDTLTPNIDDIMNRVLVSHQWMGDRFKTFLETYDTYGDLKNLLRATTAIVISYDIRPSFYWAATGAIYLDADNFWLTPEERDTLNEAPDYRSDFGSELQFAIPWRFVKDNDYLSTYITANTRKTREQDDTAFDVLSLMYHELAHANDFFPQSAWFSLDRSQQIYRTIPNEIQSDLLQVAHPLNGDEMLALAQVRYHGETATDTQTSYMPEDITQLFSSENAPQFYNYSSTREDYAMLFDGFMMKARYGIDRDVAITNQPNEEDVSSEDYIVNWGQRGRISDATIKPRVLYVTQRVLPEFVDAESILNSLPIPITMEAGKSWIDNLDITPSVVPKSIAKAQVSALTKKLAITRPISEFTHRFIEKPIPRTE